MIKRILAISTFAIAFGGQALAADLPPPPAPPPRAPAAYVPVVAPVYNWTGFYIGGNLGVGWNGGSYSDPSGNTFSSSGTSIKFLGGAQVGVNYEFAGGFLLGAEADFDFFPNAANTTNAIALTGAGVPAGSTATLTVNNGWLTTATGRLGYAFDRFLPYAKGGFAWVGSSNNKVNITSGTTGTTSVFNAGNNSNYGWTVGAGVEYAFWGNLSGRIEYDYIGLTNQTITVPPTAAVLPGDNFTGSSRSIQMITAGLNYKFGW